LSSGCLADGLKFLEELFAIVVDFRLDFVHLNFVGLVDFGLFLLELVHLSG